MSRRQGLSAAASENARSARRHCLGNQAIDAHQAARRSRRRWRQPFILLSGLGLTDGMHGKGVDVHGSVEQPSNAPSRHMPQLDALRAFAVAAVLAHHYIDPPTLGPNLKWGRLGVQLFFVLSGFLITGILIRDRDAVSVVGGRRIVVAKLFYVRRILRIFPVYYLVLLITLLVGPPDAKEQLPWLATYTYNFWVASLGWFTKYFSHFWSLCVEEQFYFLWPWLILFAGRGRLGAITIAAILLAPAYRWFALSAGFNWVATYVVTLSSLDSLGMGALLAIHTRGGPASAELERRLRFTALPAGIVGYWVFLKTGGILFDSVSDTTVALVFVWIVAATSRGFGGICGRVLEWSPVQFVGKISYGVYVYHLLVLSVVASILRQQGSSLDAWGYWGTAILVGGTLAVATVSWLTFENPINRLKARFSVGGH